MCGKIVYSNKYGGKEDKPRWNVVPSNSMRRLKINTDQMKINEVLFNTNLAFNYRLSSCSFCFTLR